MPASREVAFEADTETIALALSGVHMKQYSNTEMIYSRMYQRYRDLS